MSLSLLHQLALNTPLPVLDPLRLPQEQPGVPGGDEDQGEISLPLLQLQIFYFTQSDLVGEMRQFSQVRSVQF